MGFLNTMHSMVGLGKYSKTILHTILNVMRFLFSCSSFNYTLMSSLTHHSKINPVLIKAGGEALLTENCAKNGVSKNPTGKTVQGIITPWRQKLPVL